MPWHRELSAENFQSAASVMCGNVAVSKFLSRIDFIESPDRV